MEDRHSGARRGHRRARGRSAGGGRRWEHGWRHALLAVRKRRKSYILDTDLFKQPKETKGAESAIALSTNKRKACGSLCVILLIDAGW